MVLLEEMMKMFEEQEPSIESLVLILLEASNRNKAEKIEGYLPLYNYLVNHNTFLCNLIDLLRLLGLESEREVNTIKCFVSNLDLIDDSHRCITSQRFLSTSLKIGLPTIS
jgi:hypothetical protein